MWSLTTPNSCMFSFVWIIYRATNGLTSRFHLGTFAPSYLFQYALQRDIWSPSCPNFIMFWPKGGCLVYSSTNLFELSINFPGLFHSASNMTWTTPSINCRYPWCVCTHPIDIMGIHFLHCVHGNKWTGTHDVVRDTFVTIAWDAGFHVGRKQLHVLPSNMFNSSRWWVNILFTKNDICTLANIVFTKYGICTLVNVVIANPTRANLLPRSCATQGFVAFDAIQAKKEAIAIDTLPINSSL